MAFNLTNEQASASNPEHSVWVSANAGTGKTKILTDRVLRLMLNGTAIRKILCLTFTNAAAAEMHHRINKELGNWAIANDTELTDIIERLTGQTPEQKQLKTARELFIYVVDNPDELKIQTIHGFCQSLLKRFPLEAKIPPHFSIIEDKSAKEILNNSWLRLLTDDNKNQQSINAAISHVASLIADSTLTELIEELINNRNKILFLKEKYSNFQGIINHLYQKLNISPKLTDADLKKQICDVKIADYSVLITAMNNSKNSNDNIRAKKLNDWLCLDYSQRFNVINEFTSVFLTKNFTARKNGILTKKASNKLPESLKIIEREQQRLLKIHEQRNSLHTANATKSLLIIADSIFVIYENIKRHKAFVDYNDLIIHTQKLLANEAISPWIMYKLDGAIEHILLDEAQDTSPEQWTIIRKLCDDFFTGTGQIKNPRTVFIVGDEKQSIFSFQGADPSVFAKMQLFFSQKVRQANLAWRDISLGLSFRSTSPILNLTDKIFEKQDHRQAITTISDQVKHSVFRQSEAGLIEIWPLFKEQKSQKNRYFQLPIQINQDDNNANILAQNIAKKIHHWLDSKRLLKSKNRPVVAGDIIILVRKRGSLVNHLIKNFEQYNIPTAGADRIELAQHICIMDLISLAKFLLLPTDDLSLANILKSPLINLNEEELFNLAHGRNEKSLWKILYQKQDDSTYRDTFKFLQQLLDMVNFMPPSKLYIHIIDVLNKRKSFIARMGNEVIDPLDEFINLTIEYGAKNSPTLQAFISWFETGKTTIKRDFDQSKSAIRIMTIHGAKGLQAPIIFMPDTTSTPINQDKLLWDENNFMLWAGKAQNRNQQSKDIVEHNKQLEYNEYIRLLYVALTRAEDELYICGYQNKKSISKNCWYQIIHDEISPIATTVGMFNQQIGYRIESQQLKKVEAHKPQNNRPNHVTELPGFALTPPPKEPDKRRILSPSKSQEDAIPNSSPLSNILQYERGNLIHSLLEILPKTDLSKRNMVAKMLAKNYSDKIKNTAITQVFNILENPKFAYLFSQNSQAEVPISGIIDNNIISGKIDRLIINNDGISIIDYKTNQDNHSHTKYQTQMQIYHTILQQIYPNKQIECFILWTSTMEICPIKCK